MNLREAFKHQIENTRLLIQDDLEDPDTFMPVVWNGVIFRPKGNFYTSGKEMQVGDQLIVGYVVKNTEKPKPILIETSELEHYEKMFDVMRIVDNVPVLVHKDQSNDQYQNDYSVSQ